MASFRSQHNNSEGGTTERELSTEVGDGTNSAVGSLQREQPSHVESQRTTDVEANAKVSSTGGSFWSLMAFLSCLSVLILNPSFFYVQLINVDKKCIAFDKKEGIIGCIVLCSISDLLCLIFVVFPRWTFLLKVNITRLICSVKLLSKLLLPFCCFLYFLPLQQVLIGLVFSRIITGSSINVAIKAILVQSRIKTVMMLGFALYKSLYGSSDGKWAFILMFLSLPQVIGAEWYALGINEVSNCWKKACIHTGCRIRYCDESLNNYMHNTTISCNLGLYNDIIKYKLEEGTNFARRLSFCLRYGFQSLSCFGQNLQPNSDVLQNIFAISVCILGVSVFGIYLVLMQGFIHSSQEMNKKRKQKIKQLENSIPFRKLPENIQSKVKKGKEASIRQEITVTKGIDVVNLLSDLSEKLRKEIKRELCLEMLKQVKQFGRWSEAMIKELCDCVKPVSYVEGIYIIRDGNSINEMLFVVHGKLQTYSFKSVNTGSASTTHHRSITNIIKEGGFYGEELVTRFRDDPYSYDLPKSNKSILTLTKVDGFVLLADDLKITLIKYQSCLHISLEFRNDEEASDSQGSNLTNRL